MDSSSSIKRPHQCRCFDAIDHDAEYPQQRVDRLDVEKQEAARQKFIEVTHRVCQDTTYPESQELPALSEEQLERVYEGARLGLVYEGVHYLYGEKDADDPTNISLFKEGQYSCFTTEKIPSVIFKSEWDLDEKGCQDYVNRAKQAREFCKKNDLFLIHIPQCTYVKVQLPGNGGEQWVIMEEKVDLLGSELLRKDVCEWMVREPKTEFYSKELIKQLLMLAFEIEVKC